MRKRSKINSLILEEIVFKLSEISRLLASDYLSITALLKSSIDVLVNLINDIEEENDILSFDIRTALSFKESATKVEELGTSTIYPYYPKLPASIASCANFVMKQSLQYKETKEIDSLDTFLETLAKVLYITADNIALKSNLF